MRIQNKELESVASDKIPSDEWLDDHRTNKAKRKHLKELGLLNNELPKDILILDAGCGPGTYGVILAEEGFKVIGIDIAHDAVNKANERATKKKVDFKAIWGDLENQPFQENYFDIVFTGWVLHHFPNLVPTIKEIHRVLKPGGRFFIVEPNETNLGMRISRFIESRVNRLILKAGWDTPNRTTHFTKNYTKILADVGFIDIKHFSCNTSLPPMPTKTSSRSARVFLSFGHRLRSFLFSALSIVLPPPSNGPDMLIICRKKE